MSKPERKIWCLHKRNAEGTLAVGQKFTFPNSRDSYTVQADGSVRSDKQKLSKAEKKVLKRNKVREMKGDNTPCQN
jgi:hypothetical protein